MREPAVQSPQSNGHDPAPIGDIIAWHRRAAGLNQTQLAQRLGMSRSWLAMIEHGDRMPRAHMLLQFAELFGDEFLDEVADRWRGDAVDD